MFSVWYRGFSLNESLAMLEDVEDLVENVVFPPDGNWNETEEDSWEKDFLNINNLQGTQLQASAEINLGHDQQFPSDRAIYTESTVKREQYKWEQANLGLDTCDFEGQIICRIIILKIP